MKIFPDGFFENGFVGPLRVSESNSNILLLVDMGRTAAQEGVTILYAIGVFIKIYNDAGNRWKKQWA